MELMSDLSFAIPESRRLVGAYHGTAAGGLLFSGAPHKCAIVPSAGAPWCAPTRASARFGRHARNG